MGISSKRQQASGGFHSQYHLPSRIPTAAWWASRLPVVGRWSVLVLKEMFSLTDCILHAGRIVAQSLEKSKTHVLLYPLSQLQHAEDLLLRCKGRDILYYYFFNFCACPRDFYSWKLMEMSVESVHRYTCVVMDLMYLFSCLLPGQTKMSLAY